MPLTTVSFINEQYIYIKVYDCGTHNLRKQLTAHGVIWTCGKKREGLYTDELGHVWRVSVKAQTVSHKNAQMPDFLSRTGKGL